jgi:hypothetical protein
MRIWIRTDHPHSMGVPSDETGTTKTLCHSRCGTIKIPPCSKVLIVEYRPKVCISSDTGHDAVSRREKFWSGT